MKKIIEDNYIRPKLDKINKFNSIFVKNNKYYKASNYKQIYKINNL